MKALDAVANGFPALVILVFVLSPVVFGYTFGGGAGAFLGVFVTVAIVWMISSGIDSGSRPRR